MAIQKKDKTLTVRKKVKYPIKAQANAKSLAGNVYPDHNYSLPKNNGLLHMRSSSSDDFRIPAQPVKYVPRPILTDAPPPRGVVNPVAAQKVMHAAAKTGQRLVANPQMHLGHGLTISRDMGMKNQTTQPSQHQKPSITVIPQKVPPTLRAVPVNGSLVQNPANGSLVQNPANLSQKASNSLLQNPANLVKNTKLIKPTGGTNTIAQNTLSASQEAANKDAQALLNEQMKKRIRLIVNKTSSRHKAMLNHQKIRATGLQKRRIAIDQSANESSQNYIDLEKLRPKPKLKMPPLKPITVAPPLINTAATVAATPVIEPSASPTASTTHQSPLQMQMRSFMDHLHLLQTQMKGSEAGPGKVTPPGGGATANGASRPPNTHQGPATTDKNNFANANGSPTSRVVVKAVVNNQLNAARNLSDFTKTKSPQNTNNNMIAVASPTQVVAPVVRVIGSFPDHRGVASRRVSGTGVETSRMRINGIPVTKVVTPWIGKARPAIVKRLVPKGLSLPSGAKKVIILDKNASAPNGTTGQAKQSSPVRLVPAQLTNNPLQRKMVANLDKLSGILRHSPSKSVNKLKNGANLKTYQPSRKDRQLPRTNSLSLLSLSPQTITPVSKSNKENFNKSRLSLRGVNASIDLSKENDSGSTAQGSLSDDVVKTLKRKGVSINYVGKEANSDVIRLD